MRQLMFALLAVGALAVAPSAFAQQYDPFQRGLGAYSAGRPAQAEEFLNEAIEQTPTDPRPYYLRGLARLQLQRSEEGTADLRQGATLELAGEFPPPLLDRALANVQGPARITLEQVRRETRKAAIVAARTQLAQQQRAERAERERQVLRTRYELPIEALVNQLTPQQAKLAATKLEGPAPTNQIAAASAPTGSAGEDRPELVQEANPFDVAPVIEDAPPAVVATPREETPFVGDPFTDDLGPGPQPAAGGAPQQDPVAGLIGGFFRGMGQRMGGKAPELPSGLPSTGGGFGSQPAPFGAAPGGEGFPDQEDPEAMEEEFEEDFGTPDQESPMPAPDTQPMTPTPSNDGATIRGFGVEGGAEEDDPFADQE